MNISEFLCQLYAAVCRTCGTGVLQEIYERDGVRL